MAPGRQKTPAVNSARLNTVFCSITTQRPHRSGDTGRVGDEGREEGNVAGNNPRRHARHATEARRAVRSQRRPVHEGETRLSKHAALQPVRQTTEDAFGQEERHVHMPLRPATRPRLQRRPESPALRRTEVIRRQPPDARGRHCPWRAVQKRTQNSCTSCPLGGATAGETSTEAVGGCLLAPAASVSRLPEKRQKTRDNAGAILASASASHRIPDAVPLSANALQLPAHLAWFFAQIQDMPAVGPSSTHAITCTNPPSPPLLGTLQDRATLESAATRATGPGVLSGLAGRGRAGYASSIYTFSGKAGRDGQKAAARARAVSGEAIPRVACRRGQGLGAALCARARGERHEACLPRPVDGDPVVG